MMEDLLYYKDLYDPIELQRIKIDNIWAEDWKKLNKEVVGTITQWVDNSVFHHIANKIDAVTYELS